MVKIVVYAFALARRGGVGTYGDIKGCPIRSQSGFAVYAAAITG
ncbi:hypothetical protein Barb7_02826 [Bacteroidales bacterium Barb7]|nr:hypothetical protein Barb7_02826 [Bacteroidales bacterium Barb7]